MKREPTEMETRVALALCALMDGPTETCASACETCLEESRAAIQAMRDPTQEMRKAIGEDADCGRYQCFLNAYLDGINAASPPE